MASVYQGREQTAAKHFILKSYLQALAFKVLQGGFGTLTYVDGFSGPWESKTSDYSDTSFMIAVDVLKDAQQRLRLQGKQPKVQCFFVEEDASAFSQLAAAVIQHHDPTNDFFIYTFHGRFEHAVDEIMKVVGRSFALTFIDPTGWTGYEFEKIAKIMAHQPGEVLLNYMKSFIDRFTAKDVHKNADFQGILGQNWPARLNPALPRAAAVQQRFNEEFGAWGKFRYVLSTPVEKLEDRTAFCIVYGTRSDNGLETYRDVEFAALRDHGMRRLEAKQAMQEARTGMADMLAAAGLQPDASIEKQIPEFCQQARDWLVADLRRAGGQARRFKDVWPPMLANFTIRKTSAKNICAALAAEGVIYPTWKERGPRMRTPDDDDYIQLVS